MNKKLGIPNYLCIEKIVKSAKKTKPTLIKDLPIRLNKDEVQK